MSHPPVPHPVEFIGFVGHQEVSETRPASGPDFDIDYIETITLTLLSQVHSIAILDDFLTAWDKAKVCDRLEKLAYDAGARAMCCVRL